MNCSHPSLRPQSQDNEAKTQLLSSGGKTEELYTVDHNFLLLDPSNQYTHVFAWENNNILLNLVHLVHKQQPVSLD